jgi:hypothetical protein
MSLHDVVDVQCAMSAAIIVGPIFLQTINLHASYTVP